MHKRKQRASLLSFVWMNVDEEGGFCSFISGAQQTRMYKRTQHARLSSGWMNRDEDELLFVGFECSTDNAQEKTTCKA
jgi:hypothetical protein